jgi:membrane protein implicated in regulation of membrane protease activity
MCHLILGMPLLAIPIFWVMPPSYSVPLYAVIVLASAALYWAISRSMRRPVETGAEGLMGARVEVVRRLGAGRSSRYLVRSQGELWTARSGAGFQPGDRAFVVGVEGNTMDIEPASRVETAPGQPQQRVLAGAKRSERHCH